MVHADVEFAEVELSLPNANVYLPGELDKFGERLDANEIESSERVR